MMHQIGDSPLIAAAPAVSGVSSSGASTLEAAKPFADGSIWFCWIDAHHEYTHVRDDIAAFRTKVCTGGILAGHDCRGADHLDAIQAVDEPFGPSHSSTLDICWEVRISCFSGLALRPIFQCSGQPPPACFKFVVSPFTAADLREQFRFIGQHFAKL